MPWDGTHGEGGRDGGGGSHFIHSFIRKTIDPGVGGGRRHGSPSMGRARGAFGGGPGDIVFTHFGRHCSLRTPQKRLTFRVLGTNYLHVV